MNPLAEGVIFQPHPFRSSVRREPSPRCRSSLLSPSSRGSINTAVTNHLESIDIQQCETQTEAGIGALWSKHLLQGRRLEYPTIQALTGPRTVSSETGPGQASQRPRIERASAVEPPPVRSDPLPESRFAQRHP